MKSPEFKIFPSRANSLKIALTENNVAINHTLITRAAIRVGAVLVDSQSSPALFDLTQANYIEIKLGAASPALAVGSYTSRLIIYDVSGYAAGYVWPQDFIVHVAQEAGV